MSRVTTDLVMRFTDVVLNRPWRIVSTAADAVTAEFHASQDALKLWSNGLLTFSYSLLIYSRGRWSSG